MPKREPNAAPFALEIDTRTLPPKGRRVAVEPSRQEREAIARALDLPSLDALEGTLLVHPWRMDGIAVEGTLLAALTQACVVSLEPVAASLAVPVAATFLPEVPDGDGEDDVWLDPDGEDAPEPLTGPMLDLGALTVEFLALALDPYPRAEGARLPDSAADEGDGSPFAALSRLRERSS